MTLEDLIESTLANRAADVEVVERHDEFGSDDTFGREKNKANPRLWIGAAAAALLVVGISVAVWAGRDTGNPVATENTTQTDENAGATTDESGAEQTSAERVVIRFDGIDLRVRPSTPASLEAVITYIEESGAVESWTLVSQEEFFAEFQEEFRDNPELLEAFEVEDFMTDIRVVLVDPSESAFAPVEADIRDLVGERDVVIDTRDDQIPSSFDQFLVGTEWVLTTIDGSGIEAVSSTPVSLFFFDNDAYRLDTCVDLSGPAVLGSSSLVLGEPAARRLARCAVEWSDIGSTPVISRITEQELVVEGSTGSFFFLNGGPADRTLDKSGLRTFAQEAAGLMVEGSRLLKPGDRVDLGILPNLPQPQLHEWFTFDHVSPDGSIEPSFELRGVSPKSSKEPSFVRPGDNPPEGYVATTIVGSPDQVVEMTPPNRGEVIGRTVTIEIPADTRRGSYRICQDRVGCVFVVVDSQ